MLGRGSAAAAGPVRGLAREGWAAAVVWGPEHARVLLTGGSGAAQRRHCRARLRPCVVSLPACCGGPGRWGEHVLLWQSCAFPPGRLSWQGSGAPSSRLALANGARNSLICWVLSEIDDLCVLLVVAQPWLTAHTFAADNGKWVSCTGACPPAPISTPCRLRQAAPFAGAASPSPRPGRRFRTVCGGCRSPCVGSLQQARILPQPAKPPWTSWVLSCRISQAAAARTVLAPRGRVGVLVWICSCGIGARLQCAVALPELPAQHGSAGPPACLPQCFHCHTARGFSLPCDLAVLAVPEKTHGSPVPARHRLRLRLPRSELQTCLVLC